MKSVLISATLTCHVLPQINEIRLLLNESIANVNILCLCETFLFHEVNNNEIDIDGYKTVRKDRIGKHGGGT